MFKGAIFRACIAIAACLSFSACTPANAITLSPTYGADSFAVNAIYLVHANTDAMAFATTVAPASDQVDQATAVAIVESRPVLAELTSITTSTARAARHSGAASRVLMPRSNWRM